MDYLPVPPRHFCGILGVLGAQLKEPLGHVVDMPRKQQGESVST